MVRQSLIMKKLKLISILICSFTLTTVGQSRLTNNVFTKIDSLKKLLSQADTLRAENLWDENSIDINGLIAEQLSDILIIPSIVNYNLDSLLNHNFLGITHSKDKRLWIFSWYENTGGTFKSNVSLVHYRTRPNKPKVAVESNFENNDSEKLVNNFCSNGFGFEKIYKLKSSSKNLYLCLGSVVGCTTCCGEIASIVELTNDSINFNYPAFTISKQDGYYRDSEDNSPCFTLDSRCGSIEKFEFDSKTQTINYSYSTDDNTPVKTVEEKSKIVIGSLHFNGQNFIQKDSVMEQIQPKVSKSLKVNAGELNSLLSGTEKDIITDLVLKGTIDARDFKTMRDNMPSLEAVNIDSVKIISYKGIEGTYGSWVYGAKDTSYPANAIPQYAFFHTFIKSITIPTSVVSIEEFAFNDCWELTSISIPHSVKSIGKWAFCSCNKLDSVNIPSSVTAIGENAFCNCKEDQNNNSSDRIMRCGRDNNR